MDLLTKTGKKLGSIPLHIQRTVLYSVFAKIHHASTRPTHVDFLTPAEKEQFVSGLRQIFDYIDVETIESFKLSGMGEKFRVGLLSFFKDKNRQITNFYLSKIRQSHGLARIHYFHGSVDDNAVAMINGDRTEKMYAKTTRADLVGQALCYQHSFWVKMHPGDFLSFRIGRQQGRVKSGARTLGQSVSWSKVARANAMPVKTSAMTDADRHLRKWAKSHETRKRFENCWLLMDRYDKADDNAEHFYRYLQSTGMPQNAFFAIERGSRDWNRLTADGFRLIGFDSDEFKAAVLNAEFIISSHADRFIHTPLPRAQFGDMMRYQFVYLKHGVTKDDIWPWYNGFDPALLLAATPDEYAAYLRPSSNFTISENEVALTGLPRHDALLSKAVSEETIFIMPTWRRNLTGDFVNGGRSRAKLGGFSTSSYAQNWHEFLQSPELRAIANRHGKQIVFCPHPNMVAYIEEFCVPEHIETINPLTVDSLQPHFRRAAVMVSDYSSVTFEAGYLDKPVVYYQFDKGGIFEGQHLYKKGYFDFETHGFGPVTTNLADTLSMVDQALSGQEMREYGDRRQKTFPFRDGRCNERAYKAICELR